jgi:hypothetical protein
MYDHDTLMVEVKQSEPCRIDVSEFMKIAPFLSFATQKKRVHTHLKIERLDLTDEGFSVRFPVQ